MDSTEILVREHETILKVLEALRDRTEKARADGQLPVGFLRDMVAFSRLFVDQCHHGKEEGCLFPCMQRRGIPKEGGPIGVMLYEHEVGRGLVRRLAEQLDAYEAGKAGAPEILATCDQYVELLFHHIQKENHVLYPMGSGVMGPEDHRRTADCNAAQDGEHADGRTEGERLAGKLTGGY